MGPEVDRNCAHLNRRLRWLGVRQNHSRPVYLFQCLECGKSFCTRTPMTIRQETEQLVKLSRLSHT
jgi:hypothetical protein